MAAAVVRAMPGVRPVRAAEGRYIAARAGSLDPAAPPRVRLAAVAEARDLRREVGVYRAVELDDALLRELLHAEATTAPAGGLAALDAVPPRRPGVAGTVRYWLEWWAGRRGVGPYQWDAAVWWLTGGWWWDR